MVAETDPAAAGSSARNEPDVVLQCIAGRGVTLDYVSGYFWDSIAPAKGDGLSVREVKKLGQVMTPAQGGAPRSDKPRQVPVSQSLNPARCVFLPLDADFRPFIVLVVS
jgi:hypothetical protein